MRSLSDQLIDTNGGNEKSLKNNMKCFMLRLSGFVIFIQRPLIKYGANIGAEKNKTNIHP